MNRKRSYNIRLIKSRRTYTLSEISKLYNVHIRTAQTWHKQGMKPINPDDRPLLFLGFQIKDYLSIRQNKRKIKLKDNEFYCPRWRKARTSQGRNISIIDTGRTMGKNDKQVIIKGICQICGCPLNRFATKAGVKNSIFDRMLKERDKGLIGNLELIVNTDIEEVKNHEN